MNDKIVRVLNDDWNTFPHGGFVCAKLMDRPVFVNEHEEYEVDFIVDSKIHRGSLQYLIH